DRASKATPASIAATPSASPETSPPHARPEPARSPSGKPEPPPIPDSWMKRWCCASRRACRGEGEDKKGGRLEDDVPPRIRVEQRALRPPYLYSCRWPLFFDKRTEVFSEGV